MGREDQHLSLGLTTRRSALAAIAGAALSAPALRGAPKATAYALIGDRYHNSDYIRTGLNRTIAKELGISIDFCDETSALTSETLDGYKLLIVLRDGMIWPDGYPDENTNAAWVATGRPKLVSQPAVPPTAAKPQFWMKPPQGKAVRQFVERGGAALFLHNVTHVGLTDPDFRHVLGAAYAGHPPIRTFKVRVKNPDHPIARGVRDFIVTDEQHYMEYDKDPKNIFLETVNEEGLAYGKLGAAAPGGWAFDYGKGRVCYLSPGHLLTVLWNPEYVKLQQNAVKWVLRAGA
jgi:Trehalose utilisation